MSDPDTLVIVKRDEKLLKTLVDGKRSGIMCGGNYIIDYYKIIPEYPQKNAIVSITGLTHGSGGCAYNVLSALAKMDVNIPLYAAGAVG